MDVYLSQEALQLIKALDILAYKSDGILIGHKRGKRYFVEKILSAPATFSVPTEQHLHLIQSFEDRIIGFFSFKPTAAKRKKILAPLTAGKIFLEIVRNNTGRLTYKGYLVEFDKKFFLSPLSVKREK